jgi:hypothetical protein
LLLTVIRKIRGLRARELDELAISHDDATSPNDRRVDRLGGVAEREVMGAAAYD